MYLKPEDGQYDLNVVAYVYETNESCFGWRLYVYQFLVQTV